MTPDLIEKYNIPAPRYTSYPTVPFWDDKAVQDSEWRTHFRTALHKNRSISLYIHLPYCESMCTFCACNKRITKNHKVEEPYIESVLQEWKMYCAQMPEKPVLKELHLGGGTPTFFHPTALRKLIEGIKAGADLAPDYEFSFEAHPNSTSDEHLEVLYEVGFRRISIGVQDFAPEILKVINRNQSYESVERVTLTARRLGYDSINFDLVFGLPLQTEEHIATSMRHTRALRPDRIAFYSYAHVPWVKSGQRAYDEKDLPRGAAKRALYDLGRSFLEQYGYHEIGMDHFALASDALYQAKENGSLHRNFMGYTPLYTDLMIGLGVSAISDSWTGYVQNEKSIEAYRAAVAEERFPIFRGHLLSEEDQAVRRHILNLMCREKTNWLDTKMEKELLEAAWPRLKDLEADGLITCTKEGLGVRPIGRAFIRNICRALDLRLWRKEAATQLFSQVI